MTDELVVGIDVEVEGHREGRDVQWRVEDVEEEQGKLRRHRLDEGGPVRFGEVVVGVDLPPGHVGRPHVKYPS